MNQIRFNSNAALGESRMGFTSNNDLGRRERLAKSRSAVQSFEPEFTCVADRDCPIPRNSQSCELTGVGSCVANTCFPGMTPKLAETGFIRPGACDATSAGHLYTANNFDGEQLRECKPDEAADEAKPCEGRSERSPFTYEDGLSRTC